MMFLNPCSLILFIALGCMVGVSVFYTVKAIRNPSALFDVDLPIEWCEYSYYFPLSGFSSNEFIGVSYADKTGYLFGSKSFGLVKNILINGKASTFKFVYDLSIAHNPCNMSPKNLNLQSSSLLVSSETKDYLNKNNCSISNTFVSLNTIKNCPIIESQIETHKTLLNKQIQVIEQDQFKFTLNSTIFPSGKMSIRSYSKSYVNQVIESSLRTSPIKTGYYDNHNKEMSIGGGTNIVLTPDYYRIVESMYGSRKRIQKCKKMIKIMKYEQLQSVTLVHLEKEKEILYFCLLVDHDKENVYCGSKSIFDTDVLFMIPFYDGIDKMTAINESVIDNSVVCN